MTIILQKQNVRMQNVLKLDGPKVNLDDNICKLIENVALPQETLS